MSKNKVEFLLTWSNLRKYLPALALIVLAMAASFGLGYLLRGELTKAPIIVEKVN